MSITSNKGQEASEDELQEIKIEVFKLLSGLQVSAAKGVLRNLVDEIEFSSTVNSFPESQHNDT